MFSSVIFTGMFHIDGKKETTVNSRYRNKQTKTGNNIMFRRAKRKLNCHERNLNCSHCSHQNPVKSSHAMKYSNEFGEMKLSLETVQLMFMCANCVKNLART